MCVQMRPHLLVVHCFIGGCLQLLPPALNVVDHAVDLATETLAAAGKQHIPVNQGKQVAGGQVSSCLCVLLKVQLGDGPLDVTSNLNGYCSVVAPAIQCLHDTHFHV